MSMVVKAVVFDLDGTLASFNVDYRAVRADVRSFLIGKGLPASVFSINESIFEMLKKTEIFIKNNGQPRKKFTQIRDEVLKIAERYEQEAAKTTSLFPGVLEVLKALKEMNVKVGLCTINGEKSANFILRRFGIAKYFDAVTARDDVKYVKPNVEHLDATLRVLEVRPEETVVVGDGVSDMMSASDLKAIAVGFPTGVSSRKELAGAGANYFITSMTELPRLVRELIDKE